MKAGKENKSPAAFPFYKRIVFWLVLPVVGAGIAISAILFSFFSPPIESFLVKHFEANLRLASQRGLRICETYFDQLLDMRLEDNSEMNASLRRQALVEIKALDPQMPAIHMLVLENGRKIKAISIDFPRDNWEFAAFIKAGNKILDLSLGEEQVKAHIRYFPFWNWHIISFVKKKDYLAPISAAQKILFATTVSVLLVVITTLLFVFYHLVTKPLTRLIKATKNVSEGNLLPVNPVGNNEIGQLVGFFNDMVENLKDKTKKIDTLIKRYQESEKRYRSLVELSPEAVFVHQDSIIRYINRKGAHILGAADPQELIGRSVREFIHPDYLEQVSTRIQCVYCDHITLPLLEMKHVRLDKTVVDVEASGTYIDYYGKPAMLTVLRDVTERKEAERALRESEEKLSRSKKMESLGLLAGGVAHDLNNVLSGIVSYPELILMDLPGDSPLRKPVKTMQDAGNRAAAIVNDLLTVARGVATFKLPLNVNDIITEYLGSPEHSGLRQNHPSVEIETRLDRNLMNIQGSHVHIRKAVVNLVSNAAEAIDGRGRIELSTLNRFLDMPLKGYDDVTVGEYVVLSVADNGPGISPEDLDRIFEPFYTRKVMGRSGTGLGLAVVWNVIQDHCGYIDVKSGPAGTVFDLYLPITREEISAKKTDTPVETYQGNGETILVVDDVPSQRDISCHMLKALGYRAEAVASGEEAVAYTAEQAVDLLVLDMIMEPGMNGRQTYEKIIEQRPGQKAIIVSGYVENEEVRAIQQLGAGKFLKKPLSLEQLGMTVKEALER